MNEEDNYETCPTCDGSGLNKAGEQLMRAVRDLLNSGNEDYTQLTTNLAGRRPDPFIGHDTLDSFTVAEKIIKLAGLDPATWGICPACQGEGARRKA